MNWAIKYIKDNRISIPVRRSTVSYSTRDVASSTTEMNDRIDLWELIDWVRHVTLSEAQIHKVYEVSVTTVGNGLAASLPISHGLFKSKVVAEWKAKDVERSITNGGVHVEEIPIE